MNVIPLRYPANETLQHSAGSVGPGHRSAWMISILEQAYDRWTHTDVSSLWSKQTSLVTVIQLLLPQIPSYIPQAELWTAQHTLITGTCRCGKVLPCLGQHYSKCGPLTSMMSPERLLDLQDLNSTTDLLNLNLHFIIPTRWFISTFRFEKHYFKNIIYKMGRRRSTGKKKKKKGR